MDNLKLCSIIESDLMSIESIYKEPKNTRFIPSNLSELSLEQIKDSFIKIPSRELLVIKDNLGNVLGQAGIYKYPDSEHTLEFGYILDYPYHNKGFGTSILAHLIKRVFTSTPTKMVICRMYQENKGSERICIKNNMQLQATDILEDGRVRLTYALKKQ